MEKPTGYLDPRVVRIKDDTLLLLSSLSGERLMLRLSHIKTIASLRVESLLDRTEEAEDGDVIINEKVFDRLAKSVGLTINDQVTAMFTHAEGGQPLLLADTPDDIFSVLALYAER